MKKLLIGLLVLGSVASFATEPTLTCAQIDSVLRLHVDQSYTDVGTQQQQQLIQQLRQQFQQICQQANQRQVPIEY